MQAAGAGRAHRSITVPRRTALPDRHTARIEEDVDRGFPERRRIGQSEMLDPGRIGEDIRPELPQQLVNTLCQIDPLLDLRRLAANERESGPAAHRVAREL